MPSAGPRVRLALQSPRGHGARRVPATSAGFSGTQLSIRGPLVALALLACYSDVAEFAKIPGLTHDG